MDGGGRPVSQMPSPGYREAREIIGGLPSGRVERRDHWRPPGFSSTPAAVSVALVLLLATSALGPVLPLAGSAPPATSIPKLPASSSEPANSSAGSPFLTSNISLGPPGAYPFAIAVDPATHTVYLEDTPAVILKLDGRTGARLSIIPLGDASTAGNAPTSLALDPVLGVLWVLGPGLLAVSAVNLSTDRVVRTVELPSACSAALGMTMVPATGSVWIACALGVVALSAADGNVTYADVSTSTEFFPTGTIVYDPITGEVVVGALWGSNPAQYGLAIFNAVASVLSEFLLFGSCCQDVAPIGGGVVNAATGQLVLTVTGPNSTWGVATLSAADYDSTSFRFSPLPGHPVAVANGQEGAPEVYLAFYGSQTVGIFNLTSLTVVSTLPAGGMVATVATDPSLDQGYAATVDTAQLIVFSMPSLSVEAVSPVGGEPGALAYDQASRSLWVANSNNISVVSDVSHGVLATIPMDFGPSAISINATNDRAYVATYDDANVTVFNLTSYQPLSQFQVDPAPVALWQQPTTGELFVACQGGAHGWVDVVGVTNGSYRVITRLPVGVDPSAVFYDPASQAVLVSNTFSGNLSVISPKELRVVGEVRLPGFDPYAITYDPRTNDLFLSDANLIIDLTTGRVSSDVDVLDAANYTLLSSVSVGPVTFGIQYDPVTNLVYTASYLSASVDVIQPDLHTWSATIPVGLNPYEVLWDPSTSEVYVSNTLSANLSLIRSPQPIYPVVFREQGLPRGSWSVSLGAVTQTTAVGDPIAFLVTNGTYRYSIPVPPGFEQFTLPPQGTLTVSGASRVEPTIDFLPFSYLVSFTETGLPLNLTWSVTLNGTTRAAASDSIAFDVSNGTYPYTVNPPSGWKSAPLGGAVLVHGAPQGLSIVFSPSGGGGGGAGGFLGLYGTAAYFLALDIVLVAAAAIVAVLLVRRLRRAKR